MKKTKLALSALLLAAGALTAGSAFAWGHHGGSHVFFGFNFGVPVYSPYSYWGPYPYYYPAPVYYPGPVVVQQQPQVYTQRSDVEAPAADAQNYWYYCAESRGYYPYVKECPAGWQRVPAAPPAAK